MKTEALSLSQSFKPMADHLISGNPSGYNNIGGYIRGNYVKI
jgi:hypothetical protein